MEYNGPIVTCSALIERALDNRFLLFFCPAYHVWRAHGGRAEHNEKLEETLTREMEEEIGIEIGRLRFLGYGQDIIHHYPLKEEIPRLVMYFHTTIQRDELLKIDCKEAESFKWVTLSELMSHENIEPAMLDFFEKKPAIKIHPQQDYKPH